MKRTVAALVAALLCSAPAHAQSYPGDAGRGYQLGIQSVNNSGEVGTVTLFNRGPKTLVAVNINGAPGKAQSVRIYRGHACDSDIAEKPEYYLNDVRAGSSISTVQISYDRLLSGNYNVLVFSSNQAGARAAACGHLYTS